MASKISFVIALALLVLKTVAAKQDISYSCPTNQVLAVSSNNDKEIDLNPLTPTICGETRTCIYTKGAACLAKGQYLAAVGEVNGVLQNGCCQYSPPVQQHSGDDCHEILIETSDLGTVSQARGPPLGNNPSGGHGGAPREEVVMELKSLGAGQPNQLVKSIKRIKNGNGYSVTVCTPQCGTTTTKRPTTQRTHQSHENEQKSQPQQPQQQPEQPHKKGLLGGHHCFSSDMTVQTPTGTKRMDQVRAGDKVLVASSDSKPIYEPIEWLYHRDPNAIAEFITITTSSNRTLELSANHLIPFVPCSNLELKKVGVNQIADSQSYFARRLKIGHCIAGLTDNEFVAEKIVDIKKESKRGIYSPITNQGTILVNDLFVSCYSSVENHLMQKSIHSMLIQFRHFISNSYNLMLGGQTLDKEDSSVPLPLQMLLKMAQFVLPSNVYKI